MFLFFRVLPATAKSGGRGQSPPSAAVGAAVLQDAAVVAAAIHHRSPPHLPAAPRCWSPPLAPATRPVSVSTQDGTPPVPPPSASTAGGATHPTPRAPPTHTPHGCLIYCIFIHTLFRGNSPSCHSFTKSQLTLSRLRYRSLFGYPTILIWLTVNVLNYCLNHCPPPPSKAITTTTAYPHYLPTHSYHHHHTTASPPLSSASSSLPTTTTIPSFLSQLLDRNSSITPLYIQLFCSVPTSCVQPQRQQTPLLLNVENADSA